MSGVVASTQSEWLVVALAVLNVVQTVWLADIANRARRVRRTDVVDDAYPRGKHEAPAHELDGSDEPA